MMLQNSSEHFIKKIYNFKLLPTYRPIYIVDDIMFLF